ncbi:hypothetical protein [Methylobacter tundripaludum]|uniref:Uncharacterized protein n=1 Tax=Methylobacter tundripaludum (strain ATCC BAA-1195 / DSM 17260 / SV96) TaxID=697282 RepID=G3IWT8_METTV|nr:hypothetical protein [Methylobacter tundripaludum]EGW23147.1 hypothetical protein Mettu_1988 [Methylobacter tundripaludum SV96]
MNDYEEDKATKTSKTNMNSGIASGGSVQHSGNHTQKVIVHSSSGTSIFISIIIPIVAAVSGAYATYNFNLLNAPEKTVIGSNTLLGQVKDLQKIVMSFNPSPEISKRLVEIEQQAQAIQANVSRLQRSDGLASGEVDFWLDANSAVMLGNTTPFSVTSGTSNSITYELDGKAGGVYLPPAGKLEFKTDTGKNCFLNYMGKSPKAEIYGFKIICPA